MNKMELVSAIAEKSDLSKRDAEAALNAFTDIVADELKQTGEEMVIPASKMPKFKVGKLLKDSIK